MNKKQAEKALAERAESRATLLETLKPGMEVYTIVRSVSRSGMTRQISLYAIVNNQPQMLDYHAAKVLYWNLGREGVKVEGCGMDMAWHFVSQLSIALFKDTYALIQRNL